jgi:hypothetical protein
MTSSVISKALNKNIKNILYDPKYNLLDNIIFDMDYKFYIFGNNSFDYNIPNVINLPERLYGVYSYSMHVSYNIEKYVDDNHISKVFHIPGIIIIDPNIKSYKKEDKYILFQKVKNYHKIFLNHETFEYFGKPNKSYVIPIGIPTDTFFSTTENEKREKDVIIISDDIIAQQIKQVLEINNLSCDIVDIKFKDSKTINEILNRYKYCIDTTNNNYVNLLCAISSGCFAISTTQSSMPCPFVTYVQDIDHIIHIIKNQESKLNNIAIQEYLANNYSYKEFSNKLNSIFSIVSKEVFVQ